MGVSGQKGGAARQAVSVQPDGLPLHFFGVAGDKEAQRSLLHLDVVARVDEDAGVARETHADNRHAR